MVNYICKKCCKIFKQKSHFIAHQNKKSPCNDENKLQNNNIYDHKYEIIENLHIKNRAAHNNNINVVDDIDDNNNSNVDIDNDDNVSKHPVYVHNCILCDKIFTRASSLKRHLLENCKTFKDVNKKKNIEEDKDELLNNLTEQVKNLTKIIMALKDDKNNSLILSNNNNNGIIDNSNTKNTNIHNQINNQLNGNITTNNIKIEFGKEDLSKISNDFFIKTLLNSSGALIPSKIIEGIHFNPELNEFMNVFISDFSRNKAMIYDGKTWNIANADEIVNTLFDKAIIFCEDRNEELYDKIQKNEKIKKKINKEMHVMDIMNNNEPHEYNEYKEPVDIDGNVLVLSELKRGKSLNGKAKEHLKKSLYNKKRIVVK